MLFCWTLLPVSSAGSLIDWSKRCYLCSMFIFSDKASNLACFARSGSWRSSVIGKLAIFRKRRDWGDGTFRFPLDIVFRIYDNCLASGIEAIFAFSVVLLQKNEDILLTLKFDDILAFLKTKIFDRYKVCSPSTSEYSPSSLKIDRSNPWIHLEVTMTVRLRMFGMM